MKTKTYSRSQLKAMATDPQSSVVLDIPEVRPLAAGAGKNATRKHAFEVARRKRAVARQEVAFNARIDFTTRPLQKPLAPIQSGKQVAKGTARYEANLAKWKTKMKARGYEV